MSDVTGLKKPSGASDNDADDRLASLKARYQTKKPDTTSKGNPQHLNPKPKKHSANSTGN